MIKVLIIMIGIVAPMFSEYIKNGDIVSDTNSALQWQDNGVVKTGKYSWEKAIEYCENLELNGDDDWRLPNVRELNRIADRLREGALIMPAFENIPTDTELDLPFYWTSTSYPTIEKVAFVIEFGQEGMIHAFDKKEEHFVRCVRTKK